MLMEFIIKIIFKVILRSIFAVKDKERQKLHRFEDGRTIKDVILSISRQKEGRARHENIARRHIQHSRLTLPIAAFNGNSMTQEIPPHLLSISSTLAFSFLFDINSGWSRQSVITLTNINIGTFLFLDSTTIQHTSKFLKLINSYQYNNRTFYFSISHTFSYLLKHLFFYFLLVYTIVKVFTCLLVVWFVTQCFVLSLLPYTWYNTYVYLDQMQSMVD